MSESTEPRLIGFTPVENTRTESGQDVDVLADLMPEGVVEPNSELAMSIARKIREQRASRSFRLKRQAWKDRSFIPGDI